MGKNDQNDKTGSRMTDLYGTGLYSDQNITDALFRIAHALERIAEQRTDHPLMGERLDGLTSAVAQIADALPKP